MALNSLPILLILTGIWLSARSLTADDAQNKRSQEPAAAQSKNEEGLESTGPAPSAPAAAAAQPAQKPKPPSPTEIRDLIQALGSDWYETRESATKRLGEGGVDAVAPLAVAAQGKTLEVTCRAIRALDAIAQRGDPDTFEAAQNALEMLAEGKFRSAANRANVALGGLAAPRSRHARGRLLELGAIIKPRRPIRGIIDDEDAPPRIQIILGRRWQGGDEGLIYLRRIDPTELDSVYVTRGSKITEDAIVELGNAAPHLKGRIQERGDALLGVACDDFGACVVSTVAPNTAAARCGLQPEDIIVKYDGEEIAKFQDLTEITKRHDVGDKIKIEIKRGDEFLELEATLGEWE